MYRTKTQFVQEINSKDKRGEGTLGEKLTNCTEGRAYLDAESIKSPPLKMYERIKITTNWIFYYTGIVAVCFFFKGGNGIVVVFFLKKVCYFKNTY